jgi:hypothetical protein
MPFRNGEHLGNKYGSTHGEGTRGRRTPEHIAWAAMKARCTNQKDPHWKRYGGRGISFDARWNLYENFLEDMGRRPSPEHSLDRKNNDLGYSKDNCRWATRAEQQQNREKSLYLTVDGRRAHISVWAAETGLLKCTIYDRLRRGHSPEEAVRKGRLNGRL